MNIFRNVLIWLCGLSISNILNSCWSMSQKIIHKREFFICLHFSWFIYFGFKIICIIFELWKPKIPYCTEKLKKNLIVIASDSIENEINYDNANFTRYIYISSLEKLEFKFHIILITQYTFELKISRYKLKIWKACWRYQEIS